MLIDIAALSVSPRYPRTVTACPASASRYSSFMSASAFLIAARFVILRAHFVKWDMASFLQLDLPLAVVGVGALVSKVCRRRSVPRHPTLLLAGRAGLA